MQRRTFLQQILLSAAAFPAARFVAKQTEQAPLVLQQSPVAGFQYYTGNKIWSMLSTGAMIRLKREPDNPHDKRAVAIYAGNNKLGYLPRTQNTAPAHLLDTGHRLYGRITKLKNTDNPWQRIQLEVLLPMGAQE